MKARPFIKWAGGKGKLVSTLETFLPDKLITEQGAWTYVEPFVGGGAMLFDILNRYNIQRAVINDINGNLTNVYDTVKSRPDELIEELQKIECTYISLGCIEKKRDFYLQLRESYNSGIESAVKQAAALISLNKTCYNGLYRVNKRGQFNVPFGKYENPRICDAETILSDSAALQTVDILTGDYSQTIAEAGERTFFYIDPPYRPLSRTSSFTSYSDVAFNDDEQIRLKGFLDELTSSGSKFLLSNSDCKDKFLDELYKDYRVERVQASRSINSKGTRRGKISELAVRNY